MLFRSHLSVKNDYVGAILAFDSARTLSIIDVNVLQKLLGNLSNFFVFYHTEFSHNDLVVLKDVLERLVGFYKIKHEKQSLAAVQSGEQLIRNVDQLLEVALEKEETKATFKVWQIRDALYSDMTMEEVRAEFGRLVAPYLIDEYEKRVKEKKKRKKGKKKPPPKEPPK